MAVRIQFRRGSQSEWTSANPVLSAGEFGFETDTRRFKIGNGTDNWSALTYPATGTITGVTAGTGLTGGGTSGIVTLNVDSTIYISPTIVNNKGDLIVGTDDNVVSILPVGSPNQRLVADNNQTSGLRWASDTEQTLVDAKGDLIVGTADNTVTRVQTGGAPSDNSVFVADNAQTAGVKWSKTLTSLTLSNCTVDGTNKLGTVNVPISGSEKVAPYTLTTSDSGKYVQLGTGSSVTIPNSTFAQGDALCLVNNTSGNLTVTCSTTNAYISGVTTNRTTVTLLPRGIATVLFLSATSCLINGNVL